MRKLVMFIVSFITWMLLVFRGKAGTCCFNLQDVIAGLFAAMLTALIFGETFTKNPHKFFDLRRYLWFLVYLPMFLYWCLLANLDVVYRVFHPKMPINPGIVKVKTSLKSKSGITALCNSITLTPGTLCVDLTDDGYIYIHWINVESQNVEEASRMIIQKFEKILTRIFE